MKRFGYSTAFKGLVDDALIHNGDVDPPTYLFRMPHEEYVDWRYCGWCTVVCVETVEEAKLIASRLEEKYAQAGNHAHSG